MTKSVTVVVRVTARADRVNETAALLQELARQSRPEPGCISYQVLQDVAGPAEFLLVEQWSDEPALQAHRQTAHVASAFAQAPALLAAEPQSGIYAAST